MRPQLERDRLIGGQFKTLGTRLRTDWTAKWSGRVRLEAV